MQKNDDSGSVRSNSEEGVVPIGDCEGLVEFNDFTNYVSGWSIWWRLRWRALGFTAEIAKRKYAKIAKKMCRIG